MSRRNNSRPPSLARRWCHHHRQPPHHHAPAPPPYDPPQYTEYMATSTDPEEQLRLQQAEQHKLSGNRLFSTQHYLAAIDAYTLALHLTPDSQPTAVSILHSNLAACHLHLSNAETALSHSRLAVSLRPKWVRAHIRRLKAQEAIGGWRELEIMAEEVEALLSGSTPMEEPLTDRERWELKGMEKRVKGVLEENGRRELGDVCKGLRELGDGLLRPFGMSTADFGVTGDGNGKYSMTFGGCGKGEKRGEKRGEK